MFDQKEYTKNYYEKNKEKLKQYKKEWREKNKENIKQRKQEYNVSNKEKVAQQLKEYHNKHKDEHLQKFKEYRENNPRIVKKGRLKKYGLTLEEYDILLKKTDCHCPICHVEFAEGGRGGNAPCVDHCHKTGKVRGIICVRCNGGMGSLQDNPIILMKAIEWLNAVKDC